MPAPAWATASCAWRSACHLTARRSWLQEVAAHTPSGRHCPKWGAFCKGLANLRGLQRLQACPCLGYYLLRDAPPQLQEANLTLGQQCCPPSTLPYRLGHLPALVSLAVVGPNDAFLSIPHWVTPEGLLVHRMPPSLGRLWMLPARGAGVCDDVRLSECDVRGLQTVDCRWDTVWCCCSD